MTEAFPLKWPHGWPRHRGARESDTRFKGPTFRWDRVYQGLVGEIKKIGGSQIVVSTNQPIRQDGMPYAQQRNIDDVGVAVYFMRNKHAMVMAQDRFWSVIGNMRSLTISIEGLRQMERHGGATMMERAFDGFLALPPPRGNQWWQVLGVSETATFDEIQTAFRTKARAHHAAGGSEEGLAEIIAARSAGFDARAA